ncbi:matrixin family metalloprotease [Candidatus Uhrbacteria bacterium]|nr:matrixin family metalloprotease [Candidatus Uhrbacteria bacterium]
MFGERRHVVVKRLFVFILFCAVALTRAEPSENTAAFNQIAASDRSVQQRAQSSARDPRQEGFSVEVAPLSARQELVLAGAPFFKLIEGLDDFERKRFGLTREDLDLARRSVYQMVLAREVVSYDQEVLFERFVITTNESVALSGGMTIVVPKFDKATLGAQLFAYRESIMLGITDGVSAFEHRSKIRCGIADATPSGSYSIPVRLTERLATVPRRYAVWRESAIGSSTIGRVVAKINDATYIPELGIYHRSMTDVRIELSLEELRASLRLLQERQYSQAASAKFMRARVAKIMAHELFHTVGVFHSRRADDLMYPQYQPYVFKGIPVKRPVTIGSLVLFFPYGPQTPPIVYRVKPWTIWVEQKEYVEIMDSVDGDPADDPSDIVARVLYAITAKIVSFDGAEQ